MALGFIANNNSNPPVHANRPLVGDALNRGWVRRAFRRTVQPLPAYGLPFAKLMKFTAPLLIVFCLAAGALLSCGGGGGGGGGTSGTGTGAPISSGLASCGTGNALFSVPPMALNQIVGWEPLGHMGPPGHTFPTDHQYLYFIDPNLHLPAPALPVFAPADIRVTLLGGSTLPASTGNDYTIYFQPCAEVFSTLGHLSSLSGPLAALVAGINQRCTTYMPSPNSPVTQCESGKLAVDIKASTQIGTSAGSGAFGLDWLLQDSRIAPLHFADPSRFADNGGFDTRHTVAASEYFIASMAPQVAAKMGMFNGAVKRTVLPLGGSIAVDVDATARGYWFNPTQAYPPESSHAALSPDYVQPDQVQSFSLGVSQTNVGAVFQNFLPTTSGSVNRAFETVTADGNIYCYEGNPNLFFGGGNNVILLQLTTATSLKIEVRPGFATCAAVSPYAFGATAVSYQR